MTTLTKKKLLEELKDKETRDIFVEEHVTTGVPFQIHALREKLGITQTELARRSGMAQERISKLEDPNYEFIPKINTLLKLASVFDVPLIVRFGTWGELFEWETRLSPERLAPETFDEELESLENRISTTMTTMRIGTLPIDKFVIGRIDHAMFSFAPTQLSSIPVRIINSLDWLEQAKPEASHAEEQGEEAFEDFLNTPLPSTTLIDYTSAPPF